MWIWAGGLALLAFEMQGVVPDIVTLGKPIGNGFPMGAVVGQPTLLLVPQAIN